MDLKSELTHGCCKLVTSRIIYCRFVEKVDAQPCAHAAGESGPVAGSDDQPLAAGRTAGRHPQVEGWEWEWGLGREWFPGIGDEAARWWRESAVAAEVNLSRNGFLSLTLQGTKC